MSDQYCNAQDNMDCYYNSKWRQINDLSYKKNSISNFSILQDRIDDELSNYIIDAEIGFNPNGKSSVICDNMVRFRESFYQRKSSSPLIKNLVAGINKINCIDTLAYMIKIMLYYGIPTIFSFGLTSNFKEPGIYLFGIGDYSIIADSKEDYSPQNSEIFDKFNAASHEMYKFITEEWGYNLSTKNKFVSNILEFDVLFSKVSYSNTDKNDPFKNNHSELFKTFLEKYDYQHFWETILGNLIHPDHYIFYQNPYLIKFIYIYLSKLNESNISIIKDYLVFCLVRYYGIYTPLKKELSSLLHYPQNEKLIFVDLFYHMFGYHLEEVYQQKHRNIEKEKIVNRMFNDMREYCINSFKRTNIFTNTTKEIAIQKLKHMQAIIGCQDYKIDLSGMGILDEDFYSNMAIINIYYLKNIAKLSNKKINKRYISINNDIFSFIINAYYDPSNNIIYIPTSIMDDVFLSSNEIFIGNYGSLGAVIGHEIMHCFDNYGAMFDQNGFLNNWWSEIDYQRFNAEIDKVKRHYETFSINNINVNPDLSMPENVADIGGLKISLRTFINKYMPDIDLRRKDHQKYIQHFFEKWVKTLRENTHPDLIEYALLYDSHPPSAIRVNAPFSHLIEYYQAFNVIPGNANYLDPKDRTVLMD
jgi:putative endopeptidase